MGTTYDHLTDDSNVRFNWVLAIEGYENIITDSDNTSAALTAWGATEVTGCLPGLTVEGPFEQSLDPWSDEIGVSSLSFSILSETFAQVVFGGGASNRTLAAEDFDNDEAVLTCKSVADFTSGCFIYVGTEAIDTAGKSGTTFTGCVKGMYSPFNRNGSSDYRYGRYHRLNDVNFDVQSAPIVTDEPRTWKGKYVGLWAHRVTGNETWDALAQAQLVFSGTISEIRENTTGAVVVICEDMRSIIRDHIVFKDQFVGQPAEGVFVKAGDEFQIEEYYGGSGAGATQYLSDKLVCVSSGAAGTTQMNEGMYKIGELFAIFNAWAEAEKDGANLACANKFSFYTTGTYSCRWSSYAPAAPDHHGARFYAPKSVLDFLGYNGAGKEEYLYRITAGGYSCTARHIVRDSDDRPFRVMPIQRNRDIGTCTIDLAGSTGTWVDMRDWMPEPFRGRTDAANNDIGAISVGGKIAIARHISDTQLELSFTTGLAKWFGFENITEKDIPGIRWGDDDVCRIKQILIMQGTLRSIAVRLLASTGHAAYNHATWDDLPYGIGAGIPWGLISNIPSDIYNLQEGYPHKMITVFLDEPTALTKILGSEMLIRNAAFMIKEGVLRVMQYQYAKAVDAVWTLTEDDKAAPAEAYDPQLTTTEITDRYMRNYCVVRFNRQGKDAYKDSVHVRNQASIDDHGVAPKVTIDLPNYWANAGSSGDAAIKMVSALTTSKLPVYGQPMRIVRRTISQRFFFAVPGEIIKITDSFVRDPTTGERGVTLLPGLLIRHSCDWGGPNKTQTGEIEMMVMPRSIIKRHVPAGLVEFSGGSSGIAGGTIDVEDNEYSYPGDEEDWMQFETGDNIEVEEVDPDTPGSPLHWGKVVDSVGSGQIVCTTSITAEPDYDSSKMYIVRYANYGTVGSSQQDYAYQAADTGIVGSATLAMEMGTQQQTSSSIAAPTVSSELPERYSNNTSDGDPLTPWHVASGARMVNNLVNYKTSVQMAFNTYAMGTSTSRDGYTLYTYIPVFVGAGLLEGGEVYITAAPFMYRSAGSGTAAVRMTVSADAPRKTNASNWLSAAFEKPYVQTTWTTTAASLTLQTASSVNITGIAPPGDGVVWVSFEGFSESSTATSTEMEGVGEFWVGAISVGAHGT